MSKKHSKYGPSKASRWLHCHASVIEEAKYPSTSSTYAQEGSCAHRLAEMCLSHAIAGTEPPTYVGTRCDETGLTYDEDMQDAVDEYVAVVLSQYNPARDKCFIETKLHAPTLHPDLFGTADCIIQTPKRLITVDFKYGRGVDVEARGNEQMLTYTLMARELLAPLTRKFKQIIVQPRAANPDARVTEWVYGLDVIDEFHRSMIAALEVIDKLSASKKKVIASDHYAPDEKRCHFCRASGNCKAQSTYMLQVMSQDYEAIDDELPFVRPVIDAKQVAWVLSNRKAITEWMNAVEASAIAALQHSASAVEGFKIVHGRTNRAWIESDENKLIKKILKALPSLDMEDITSTKLKSVAQIESLVKKDEAAKKKLSTLWDNPIGKLTLVPDTDGRKGVSSLDDYE